MGLSKLIHFQQLFLGNTKSTQKHSIFMNYLSQSSRNQNKIYHKVNLSPITYIFVHYIYLYKSPSITERMISMTRIAFIVFAFIVVSQCFAPPKRFPTFWENSLHSTDNQESLQYQTLYFDQKVSHFNFQQTGKTFKQKYLLDTTNWDKTSKGPILMYCGNEGPIEMFYKNSGFYNDVISKDLKGMIVYPEHRYFGVSMPFGDQKTSYLKENLVYLTTEEAMMDFVEFIKFLKKNYCEDCPVIVFGGSYGGMLASWMRMKYPNVVDFAHAASAPIYYYKNRQGLDLGVFFQIVTKNYQMHSSNCADVIREGFFRLSKYSGNSSAPINDLTQAFNLCKPLKSYKDIPLLMQYLNDGFSYMAMLNYPYPTSFLKNLTAWPANSSCIPIDSVTPRSEDKDLFTAIRKAVEYYYSFGKSQCNQIYEDGTTDEDMSGWNVLACGDQAMPMNMNGVSDMFYPEKFDYNAYSDWCFDNYGIRPDYEYTLNHFGGVTDKEYLAASHIIFTNGGLDPWSGASPTKTLATTLPSCYTPLGAHHLDLRPPNPADPADVVQCRKTVLDTLKRWIAEKKLTDEEKRLRYE